MPDNCQQFNSLLGNKSEWQICWDIPVYEPSAVIYQYPGEGVNRVENGYRWTCPGPEVDVYLLNVLVNIACSDGSRPLREYKFMSVEIPCIIYGDIQKQPGPPPGTTGWSSSNNPYHSYVYELFTNVGTFGAQISTETGTFATRSDYNDLHLPSTYIGTFDPAGQFNPNSAYTRTLSAMIKDFQHLGIITLSQPPYTFTIYDKDGNTLFSRQDDVCPAAHIQPATCMYTGNWKTRTVTFNNQSNAYLTATPHSEGNQKCVSVYKVAFLGIPNTSSGTTPGGFELLLDVCSPANCDIFPKVYTAPGFGENCPDGTCQIDCGDSRCCYDSNGNLVKTIPISSVGPQGGIINPNTLNQNRQRYIDNLYNDPNEPPIDSDTLVNYFLQHD